MKLKLLLAASLFIIASGVSTANAADSSTPALLSALSADSVKTLSTAETEGTRGERVTIKIPGFEVCKWGYCVGVSAKYKSYWVPVAYSGGRIYMVNY